MPKNTLTLFRIILANLPPFFPKHISEQMKSGLEQLENDTRVVPKMVEDMMIKYGYDLWPWNEAYREFMVSVEGRLGEQFLLSRLSKEMANKYLKYQDYGMSWQDLYSGKVAQYFEPEERQFLGFALTQVKKDLIRFTDQEIRSLHKEKYLKKVDDFKNILTDLKLIIDDLYVMADKEEYHPVLVHEIREKARCFEMGLCLLAPAFLPDEANRAIEFFNERRDHLNLLKGIEKPIMVNFY